MLPESDLDQIATAVAIKLSASSLPPPKTILNAAEAAAFLGVSVDGLRLWRREGRGPRYKMVGNKATYKVEDLLQWWDALPEGGAVQ